jgi:hypothetical protein
MLLKKSLLDLGFVFATNPQSIPEQASWVGWTNPAFASEERDINAFATESEAICDASESALESFELHQCDACGKLHALENLDEVRHLSMRVAPGGVFPSGQCSDPDCGALCYPFEVPDWETVMAYFGLDTSFQWDAERMIRYTQEYADANSKRLMSKPASSPISQVKGDQTVCAMQVSLDGGSTFVPAINGVRIIYRNMMIPGEDGTGELHINATHEGIITDVWLDGICDQPGSTPSDANLGTSSEMIEDIICKLVSLND